MEIGEEGEPIDVPVPVHPAQVPPIPVIPAPAEPAPEPAPAAAPDECPGMTGDCPFCDRLGGCVRFGDHWASPSSR